MADFLFDLACHDTTAGMTEFFNVDFWARLSTNPDRTKSNALPGVSRSICYA